MCFAKVLSINNQLKYVVCRICSVKWLQIYPVNVDFNIFRAIQLCISWINKRLYTTKIHGTTVKMIEAQQAKLCNSYKNTKLTLLNRLNKYAATRTN